MAETVAWDGPFAPRTPATVDVGLREQKKRLTRQHLTDVATEMFLRHGFDAFRVADVASACGVSEKTVYNYFPSKESLVLDRWETTRPALESALGRSDVRPIDAVLQILHEELDGVVSWLLAQPDPLEGGARYVRFGLKIKESTTLRAHQRQQVDLMVDLATEALAARHGPDTGMARARIAATGLVGLWDVQALSLRTHLTGRADPADISRLVGADVAEAASVLRNGIESLERDD